MKEIIAPEIDRNQQIPVRAEWLINLKLIAAELEKRIMGENYHQDLTFSETIEISRLLGYIRSVEMFLNKDGK